jgi:predicted PurR-regulated permease PerM
MKQTVWYILVIAFTLVVLILLWQFSISIVLFALSLAVAAALRPIINNLAIRTKSKRLALSLVYSLVIGSILVLLVVGGQLLLKDLQKVTDDFATSYERIKNDWPREESLFRQTLAEQLPSSDDLYQAMTSEQGLLILTEEGGPGQGFFSSFGYIAIILVLSIYWSADQLRFERITVSLFPTDHRPKALHILRTVEKGVGAYLRSELLQSLLAGLILGVGYGLLELRYPVLLAVWGAVVRLIPWFGVLIAILPFMLLGVGSVPFSSFLAVVYTVLVLYLLRTTIEPRVVDQQRNNSLLIVLFVIILAEAFGFIGVLLAPPLAVAVQILLQELYPLFARRYSQELREAFELKKRLSKLRRNVKSSESSEAMRFVNQLYQLVRQTITYMQKY